MRRILLTIILVITVILFSMSVYSQTWVPLGSGFNREVRSFAVYNNQLIAAGWFETSGGDSVNNIAKWSGSNWSSLGGGTNGSIWSLALYNNELIAGGILTTAGGDSARSVAKWNGTSWGPLGIGMGSPPTYPRVFTLTVYNNELIAGGDFIIAGGVSCSRIAKWNGTTWASLGSGLDYWVFATTVYNNELIAGGWFVGGIKKWNGNNWVTVGSGLGNTYCLTVYNNELIAGGEFSGGIKKWDGTSWITLGGGTSLTVYALTVYNNELIAGGNFTSIGGISANRIAKWNGTVWSPIGSGMNGNVVALNIYNNELIAGGNFTMAGGLNANSIARWSSPTGIEFQGENIPTKFLLQQNYPNPFNPRTIINFQLPENNFVTLRVYDISGKEVATLINGQKQPGTYEAEFNGLNLPSGIYLYKLTAGDYQETKKMMLIK